jgi:chaperonin GroES
MRRLKRQDADANPASVRPLRDMVLVRIDDRDERTPGGLVIPHVARDLPNTARVVAVGPRCTACTVGDRVVIEKYAHADREFLRLGEDASRHLLVRHEQVVAVLS